MDCCNQGSDRIKSKGYPHCTYITLNPPLLKNIDEHGLIAGTVKNIGDLVLQNIPTSQNLSQASFVKWGFIVPSPTGINMIQELVESQKVRFFIKICFK